MIYILSKIISETNRKLTNPVKIKEQVFFKGMLITRCLGVNLSYYHTRFFINIFKNDRYTKFWCHYQIVVAPAAILNQR